MVTLYLLGILLIIISTILIGFSIFVVKHIKSNFLGSICLGALGVFCLILGTISIISAHFEEETKPTALDVYRGNTILQITYQDSIPVDSVVVFK